MFFAYVLLTVGVIILSSLRLRNDSAYTMCPFLNKSYRLVSSDKNFEQVLKHLDVGWFRRKVLEFETTELKLAWDPNTNVYTLAERSFLRDIEVHFQIGVWFHEDTVDGRGVHALFTLHSTTLIETQMQPGKPTLIVYRKFSATHVVVRIQIKDVISYRVYDAV